MSTAVSERPTAVQILIYLTRDVSESFMHGAVNNHVLEEEKKKSTGKNQIRKKRRKKERREINVINTIILVVMVMFSCLLHVCAGVFAEETNVSMYFVMSASCDRELGRSPVSKGSIPHTRAAIVEDLYRRDAGGLEVKCSKSGKCCTQTMPSGDNGVRRVRSLQRLHFSNDSSDDCLLSLVKALVNLTFRAIAVVRSNHINIRNPIVDILTATKSHEDGLN